MAMTERELLEKRARLWENAKEFVETHRGSNGCLSAEDDATYSRMEEDIQNLTKEIERERKRVEMDKMLNGIVGTPMTTKPGTGNHGKTGRATDEYRLDFTNYLRGKQQMYNVLSVGTAADGGYLVPEELEKQIISGLTEAGVVRSMATVITTESKEKIPVVASHSVATWTAENGDYTESNPTFGQLTIDAFKLTDLIRVSEELMEDSAFNLEAFIAEEIAQAFAEAEETAFCVGTGIGQPTGIFTANGGTVGVTAASSSAVTTDELIDLVYSLKAPYRKKANWLMNDTTVKLVRKLKDGNGVYLWQPAVQAGQPDQFMGYTLMTSTAAPTIAAGAMTIGFGDFKHYWIADRSARTIRRLNEKYATAGQVGFIATERLDAKMLLPEAVKLLKMKS